MKLLNPFSDDCFLKLVIHKHWCHKIGYQCVWILLFGSVGRLSVVIDFFFSPGAQEGEGPGHLWGREELQGFRQPAYGPRQCSSFWHPCQESQRGCRARRGKEEVRIVTMELCKIKCLKKNHVSVVIMILSTGPDKHCGYQLLWDLIYSIQITSGFRLPLLAYDRGQYLCSEVKDICNMEGVLIVTKSNVKNPNKWFMRWVLRPSVLFTYPIKSWWSTDTTAKWIPGINFHCHICFSYFDLKTCEYLWTAWSNLIWQKFQ